MTPELPADVSWATCKLASRIAICKLYFESSLAMAAPITPPPITITSNAGNSSIFNIRFSPPCVRFIFQFAAKMFCARWLSKPDLSCPNASRFFQGLGYFHQFSRGTQFFIFVRDKFCVLLDKGRSGWPEVELFRMIPEKLSMDPRPNQASVR